MARRQAERFDSSAPARVSTVALRCGMPYPSWNDRYASGEPLPWDSGTPDPMLIEMVESRAIAPGRTLDVGCGTGTNAIYLADHGFEVMGVDLSPVAIEQARARAHGRCRFNMAATPTRPSAPGSRSSNLAGGRRAG